MLLDVHDEGLEDVIKGVYPFHMGMVPKTISAHFNDVGRILTFLYIP